MSKKIFLKKSYADIVRGNNTNDHDEQADFGEGESVIKTKYMGFPYKRVGGTSEPQESPSTFVRKSPRKAPAAKTSNTPRKVPQRVSDPDDYILLSDASLSPSPKKKSCLTAESPIIISSDSEIEPPTKKARRQIFSKDEGSSDDSLPDIPYAEEIEYFKNEKLLPIYDVNSKGAKTLEVVRSLLQNVPSCRIAKMVPYDIDRNVSFIVSQKAIGNWKNLMSDEMGSWVQSCTNKHSVDKEGNQINIVQYDDSSSINVFRYNYRCKSSVDLHKIIVRIESENELLRDKLYVQYYFDSEEHSVKIMKHGNSKVKNMPYYRTNEDTKNKIKILAGQSKPKDIFHQIIEDQGGLCNISSISQKARDRQQISNFNRSEKKDIVLKIMDQAKLEELHGDKIIRDISTAPELKVFLATDDQLFEISNFCTNTSNFSILGVDTTFNLGDFYATVTTYRHPLLLTNNNVEPVMIGPTLLHQKRTFDSFFSLPENMLKYRPDLSKILVFGTDGEVNLSDAFQVSLPNAKHLLCDLHMRDNIKSKLKELGISGEYASLFLTDIFGKQIGQQKIPGLVDVMSDAEFDKKLAEMETKWKSYHHHSDKFITYFQNFKAPFIKNCMTAELRSMCGLGFPPKPYTQNANECANSVIKSDVKHKKSTMDEFINSFKKTVKRQHHEILLSISNQGQYKVKPEYEHLKVDERQFYRKTETQKEKIYESFTRGLLETRQCGFIDDQPGPSRLLSVSVQHCGIISVPQEILEQIFKKAENLICEKNLITGCPGVDTNKGVFMVASSKNELEPHLVKSFPSGQVICDKNCLRFQSYKICSHSVAVAEKRNALKDFLCWYVKQKDSVSFTNLSNFNLSKGRGKKPHKATQIRKGPANKRALETLAYVELPSSDVPSPRPPDNGYLIYLLKFCDKKVSICYGCKGSLRVDSKIPDPPKDLVIVTRTKRRYVKDGVQHVGDLGNVYFHVNSSCVKLHNSYFVPGLVCVPDDIKPHLQPSHLEVLRSANIQYVQTS